MFSIFKKKKADGLIALSADKLLAPYVNLLNLIHQQVGVPETHWKAVYLQFIHNFAEQVQLLPASESHHHSGTGGLLTHSLEVGLNALKIRKGKMLPVGASSEVIEEQKELWSYAVFTAAMLHDIGKPLTDQIITIVSENPIRILAPLTETIPEKAVYRIEFRRGRRYRSHENVALLLAPKIVPPPGLDWITSNNDVLDDWSYCLTGRKTEANTLGDLVTQADQISTAQNLTGATNIPLPSAKVIPLSKRLQTALIYLIDDGVQIPLNRQGAAGFVYDNNIWLMSKRVLDDVRAHMLNEGQSGVPSDNTRLMDELMQNGIITPSEANRATWKVTVTISNKDGNKWENDFNLLCCPLSSLWPDPSAWPDQLDTIKVTPIINDKDEKVKPTNKESTKQQVKPREASTEEPDVEATKPLPSLDDILHAPPGITIENKEAIKKVSADEDKQNIAIKKKAKAAKEKKDTDTAPADMNFEKKIKATTNDGQNFVDWFSNGIADGSMSINVSDALVHTVGEEKSLLLVSPLIFKKYAKLHPSVGFEQLQRDFQSLNLHKITPQDTNIWKFETISDRKNKKSKTLRGMLIETPEEKLNIRLPTGNSHLAIV